MAEMPSAGAGLPKRQKYTKGRQAITHPFEKMASRLAVGSPRLNHSFLSKSFTILPRFHNLAHLDDNVQGFLHPRDTDL
jgi:hypothetical protein